MTIEALALSTVQSGVWLVMALVEFTHAQPLFLCPIARLGPAKKTCSKSSMIGLPIKMKVVIISRQIARDLHIQGKLVQPFSLISICEPFSSVERAEKAKDSSVFSNAQFAELAQSTYCHSALCLRFEDTIQADHSHMRAAITLAQARAVAQFLKMVKDSLEDTSSALKPELLIIHCAAGISRSPAIGKAAAVALGQQWKWLHDEESPFIPNSRVYDMIYGELCRL